MRLRNILVFSPLIVGLALGCSENEGVKPLAPDTSVVKAPDAGKAAAKRGKKDPSKQLGPEGLAF